MKFMDFGRTSIELAQARPRLVPISKERDKIMAVILQDASQTANFELSGFQWI